MFKMVVYDNHNRTQLSYSRNFAKQVVLKIEHHDTSTDEEKF